MSIDQREFRNAMGAFATGVTVITTLDGQRAPVGVTVNSFTSLSLDPPMVLFCLDLKSNSFQAFHQNRHFAVNILREDQVALSSTFAKSSAEKWSGVEFHTWETGCPVFEGCIANMECDVASIYEGGDHVIIVGQVRRMQYERNDCKPLLYYRGRYGQIGEAESPQP